MVFFLFPLLVSFSVLANTNPFEPFLGKYETVASVCYLNQVEYTDGCASSHTTLAKGKASAASESDFILTESFPGTSTATSHRLFESKADKNGVFTESAFSSQSLRHAEWSFVLLDSKGKEERKSIEMERTKDGVELTFIHFLKGPGSLATSVRSYLVQPK